MDNERKLRKGIEPVEENATTRHGFPYNPKSSSMNFRPEYGCRWAVIIGINSYKNLPPLKCAITDARGMAKLLISEFNFREDHILQLEDQEATRDAIREILIDRLPNETQSDDCVLVFFAGHGAKRKLPDGGEKGYLAPVDAKTDQWTSYLAISELTDAANMTAAKHIFYIVDSCYSGFATTRTNFQPTRYQQDLLTHRARLVLTAGLDDQVVSDLGPNGHSIFTYHLIQGLKGYASNGPITASQLISYVRENVGKDLSSRQTPDFGFLVGHESGGDFVFLCKTKSDSSGWIVFETDLFKEAARNSQEMQELQDFISRDRKNEEYLRCLFLAAARGQIDLGKIISGIE
jgi:hypothetical protein